MGQEMREWKLMEILMMADAVLMSSSPRSFLSEQLFVRVWGPLVAIGRFLACLQKHDGIITQNSVRELVCFYGNDPDPGIEKQCFKIFNHTLYVILHVLHHMAAAHKSRPTGAKTMSWNHHTVR